MSEPQTMVVKFDDLPLPVRERLWKLLSAPKDPRLLAYEVRTVFHGIEKFTLVVSAVAIVWSVWFALERLIRYSIGSDPLTYLILAGAGTVFLSSAVTIALHRRWPAPPWRAARWALPGAIIETDGGWLEITPISTLGKPTIVTVRRNGQYSYSDLRLGGKLTFSFGSPERVEAACARILEAKAQVAALVARGDLSALAELDPFAECTLSGNWGRPGALSIQGPTVAARPRNTAGIQFIAPVIISVIASIGLAVVVEVITAAERRRQAAIELAKPLEVQVTEGVLKIPGVGEVRPRMEGTTYLLPVGELRGLKYEIGGVAGAVTDGTEVYKLELGPQLGGIPLAELGAFQPDVSARLEVWGRKAEVRLPAVYLRDALATLLGAVEKGPVPLAPDSEGSSIALVRPGTFGAIEIFGNGTRLADVRLIANQRMLPAVTATKTCERAGGLTRQLELKETEVIVYDRRTGAIVTRKLFPPDTDCPSSSYPDERMDSYPPTSAVSAWVTSLLTP